MKKLLFISLLIGLLFSVSCAAPTCEEQTVDYRAAVDDIVERWDDAAEIANSTARMSLSGPLGELQDIKRDTGDIEVPECAADAHAALIDYQETIIDSFLAFMGQEDDETVSRLFSRASDKLTTWAVEYSQLTEEPTE